MLRVGWVGGNQQPGKAGDRISILARRIGNRYPEVGGHLHAFGRGGGALQAGLDEVVRGILHYAERNLILQGVNQFDIADRARQLADRTRHAFVALASDTYRPLYRSALAYDCSSSRSLLWKDSP